ncbi:M23 family metallopeptidase [Candidatus Gracilibacteria bacterium]|nr:M23 family metallopeptidase [Candidatus Gracilibacteria bacterium]
MKRRYRLYRIRNENVSNSFTLRDFWSHVVSYTQLGRVSKPKKAIFVVILALVLSTEQANFINITVQAEYSIDDEYISDHGLFTDKPMLTSSEVNSTILEYVIQPGDTIDDLVSRFHISASTITQANNLSRSAKLEAGKTLKILPVSGLLYTIAKGDSVAKVAGIYQVPAELIMYQNSITSDKDLKVGNQLIIPNGIEPVIVSNTVKRATTAKPTSKSSSGGYGSAPTGTAQQTKGTLNWPTTCRTISRGFNPAIPHWGVDCANSIGTSVYAAEAGKVITASAGTYGGGYGNYIIIDHGNGLKTLYAHLYKVGVSVGQQVERGEGIGLMGSTGRSTGPHLHFEVIVNNKKIDPYKYL